MRVTFPSREEMMFLIPDTIYRFKGEPQKYRLTALYWDELAAEFEDVTPAGTREGLAAVAACFGDDK